MNGKDLYFKYSFKRDYSGSDEDNYAQLLETLFFHLGQELFPLLEKAEQSNKMLSIKEEDSSLLVDSYSESDILLV